MKISVIGSGNIYQVGGMCFAQMGNKVIYANNDSEPYKEGVISIL